MSSGAEAPRPLSSVLGSPNNKGGGIIERGFPPQRPGDTLEVQSLETEGLARGEKGLSPGNPPKRT